MKRILALLLVAFTVTTFAQQDSIAKPKKRVTKSKITPFETGGTVQELFDYVYKSSTSFKGRSSQKRYKSVNEQTYIKLQKHAIDSINKYKQVITNKAQTIQQLEQQNQNIVNQLKNVQGNLDTAIAKKQSRVFLGIEMEKSSFTNTLATTYIILIILLAFFVFKFSKNNVTTKKALSDLKDLENEFEKHKKTSLTRFQEVNRKLQDELNKKWKAGGEN